MKKFVLAFFGVIVVGLGIFAGVLQFSFMSEQKKTYDVAPFSIKDLVAKSDINLGKRIYSVRNGCIDCHGADLSGAKVMENPAMGTIYGANITPYALAKWSDEDITKAIRYGVHQTGRSLQFMPSFDFEGLSIDDIAALVAYIRSVPSVDKANYPNSFGPIAKMLSFFGKMPVMFPAKSIDLQKGFQTKPAEAPNAEFGKYLVNSCTGCHGPELRGGKIPGGDPSWPDAPNLRFGSQPLWTEALFVQTIKTQISARTKEKMRPPMPINLLAQMDDLEVKAIWEYLSSLK